MNNYGISNLNISIEVVPVYLNLPQLNFPIHPYLIYKAEIQFWAVISTVVSTKVLSIFSMMSQLKCVFY